MECAAFFLWMTQFPVQPYGLRIQALLFQQYKHGTLMPQTLQTSLLSHRFSKHWDCRSFPMMCQMGCGRRLIIHNLVQVLSPMNREIWSYHFCSLTPKIAFLAFLSIVLFGDTNKTYSSKGHHMKQRALFLIVLMACMSISPALASIATPNAAEDSQGTTSYLSCLLYTSPSPRDATLSRMPSSA